MIIRKLFKFESAHIVRNCVSDRCKYSIHGHSYKAEVFLESKFLDNGQMVIDFGVLKNEIKDLIDGFDHTTVVWNRDDKEYIDSIKKFSKRWVSLPVSPSAEQLSRVIFLLVEYGLKINEIKNGEKDIKVSSIIVHETDTGYAQCFREDVYSDDIELIDISDIEFSIDVIDEWKDKKMWEKILKVKK